MLNVHFINCTPSHFTQCILESPPELFVLFPLYDLENFPLCLIVLPIPCSLQPFVQMLPSVSLSMLKKVMALAFAFL